MGQQSTLLLPAFVPEQAPQRRSLSHFLYEVVELPVSGPVATFGTKPILMSDCLGDIVWVAPFLGLMSYQKSVPRPAAGP